MTITHVSMSCVEKAEPSHDLCSQLLQLDDLQSSYLLLKFCHLTRMNHLARTVSPPMFSSAAQAHHALSYQTLCSILGFDTGSDNRGLQSCLPVRLGGLGITQLQQLSPVAYLSAWAHSLHELPLRSANGSEIACTLQDDIASVKNSISMHLVQAYSNVMGMLSSDSDLATDDIFQLLANPNKLQSRLTSDIVNNDLIKALTCSMH